MSKPDPFVIVPKFVILEAPDAIAVYTTVRLYADYETGECYPKLETIAKILDVSVSTVQRKIGKLVEIGAMGKQRTGRANRYRFQPNRLRVDDLSDTSPMTDQTGHQEPLNEELPNETQLTTQEDAPRRDLLWETFVEVHGEPATKSERGKYNTAVKKLRDAEPTVSPDEYPSLVAAFTEKNDGLQAAIVTVAERIGELRHYRDRGPVRLRTRVDRERDREFADLEDDPNLSDREKLAIMGHEGDG